MYALKHLQATSGTWYWAVSFSRNGRRFHKRFYEPMYGGSARARQAAITWRDEQLAQAEVLGVLEFCQKKRSNNSSGVPGVTFLTSTRQPEGIWQAGLKLAGGKRMRQSFSVREHGYQQAFEMAVAARQNLLVHAQDRPYLYAAEALMAIKKSA